MVISFNHLIIGFYWFLPNYQYIACSVPDKEIFAWVKQNTEVTLATH